MFFCFFFFLFLVSSDSLHVLTDQINTVHHFCDDRNSLYLCSSEVCRGATRLPSGEWNPHPPPPRIFNFKVNNKCKYYVWLVAAIYNLVVVVQSLSHVWIFVTPRTVARQAPLSSTVSWEFAEIHVHWVGDASQPSHPLLPPFPPAFNLSQNQSFPVTQLFVSGGQSIEASTWASVNIQGWFPLGLTGLISLLSKGLSRVLM